MNSKYQDQMCQLLDSIVKDESDAHAMYHKMYGTFGNAPPRIEAISGQEHEHYEFFKGVYNMMCNPTYNQERGNIVREYLHHAH